MIKFKTIRMRNYFSVGNDWLEITLDKSPITLIVGKNGAGKSSLTIDAITFALFGKAFRNINKPTIVNSINQKDCVVELEFEAYGKQCKVIRGIKPVIFEIWENGKLIDQESRSKDYQKDLENIIKMTYRAFSQIVVLGSARYIPFMLLPADKRRAIIEDLLDIQIFSSMNSVLKKKMAKLSESFLSLEKDKEITNIKIQSLEETIEKFKISKQQLIDQYRNDINKNQIVINESQQKNSQALLEIIDLQKEVDRLSAIIAQQQQFSELKKKISRNRQKLMDEIEFFSSNEGCPTCFQIIDIGFKEKRISDKNNKVKELDNGLRELDSELKTFQENSALLSALNAEIQKLNRDIMQNNISNEAIQKYINKIQNNIDELENNNQIPSDEETRLNEIQNYKLQLEDREKQLIEQRHYYEIAATMLKDTGIKTKIVKQYIPIINKLVNKYLTSMEFGINFNLNENFVEEIKSRYRDVFSYENFSEGEKRRIDIALLLTWREVAQLKNSLNCNVLILDEVMDGSLDADGLEDLMKILNSIDKRTNVFIISHRDDVISDKFEHVMRFRKINNFSKVEFN